MFSKSIKFYLFVLILSLGNMIEEEVGEDVVGIEIMAIEEVIEAIVVTVVDSREVVTVVDSREVVTEVLVVVMKLHQMMMVKLVLGNVLAHLAALLVTMVAMIATLGEVVMDLVEVQVAATDQILLKHHLQATDPD
jgi:hypothetical protein